MALVLPKDLYHKVDVPSSAGKTDQTGGLRHFPPHRYETELLQLKVRSVTGVFLSADHHGLPVTDLPETPTTRVKVSLTSENNLGTHGTRVKTQMDPMGSPTQHKKSAPKTCGPRVRKTTRYPSSHSRGAPGITGNKQPTKRENPSAVVAKQP